MPAPRRAAMAALTAATLGLTNAAVSAYWLVGGTALLDTVGGGIEAWGRRGSAAVIVVLGLIVVAKVVVALTALGIAFPPDTGWFQRRMVRGVGWTSGTILTAYGGVLTVVGLLVQAGVITASADADRRALAWHTYLWDPWFLLWGTTMLACLWMTRSDHGGHRSCADAMMR